MSIEVKTYKEYLADEAEASKEYVGDHCFVAGCTNPPPHYKVGDARYWCGMCDEHAAMRRRYLDYIRTKLLQPLWHLPHGREGRDTCLFDCG